MIAKIILYVILYLILGSITLAVALWHDRNCEDDFHKWVEDELWAGTIVVMFPMVWLVGLTYFLFIKFPVMFAHFLMAIPTTIIYTLKAFKDKEDEEPFINKPCVSEGVCKADTIKVLEEVLKDIDGLVGIEPLDRISRTKTRNIILNKINELREGLK